MSQTGADDVLTFTKDKEIPFVDIIDFFRPSRSPHHRSGGHSGGGGGDLHPRGCPIKCRGGLLGVCHLVLPSRCRGPAGHSAGWPPDAGGGSDLEGASRNRGTHPPGSGKGESCGVK